MNTSVPGVTAIIPAYNAEAYVGEAIESVLRQTAALAEVIVVDDGSTDGTRHEVLGFKSKVRYIHQRNSGVSAARNRGIAEARTNFVAVLDADDVWLPQKTSAQLVALAREPEAVAAGCGQFITDEQLTIQESRSVSSVTFRDVLLCKGTGGLSGSGLLIRTDVLRSLGGYDTRLSTSADWDLALRLLASASAVTVEEPLFLYRQHSSNMHNGIRAMEHDMLLGLRRAVQSGHPLAIRLQRAAMGRLYSILAGSYWHCDEPAAALRCGLQVLRYTPSATPNLMRRLVSKAPIQRWPGPA